MLTVLHVVIADYGHGVSIRLRRSRWDRHGHRGRPPNVRDSQALVQPSTALAPVRPPRSPMSNSPKIRSWQPRRRASVWVSQLLQLLLGRRTPYLTIA